MAEFGDVRLNDLQNFQSRILKLSKSWTGIMS